MKEITIMVSRSVRPEPVEGRSRRSFQISGLFCLMVFSSLLFPVPSHAQPMAPSAVLIDRADREAITGYTEIAYAWGQMFMPPQSCPRSIINLKEAMNRWTNIKTELRPHILLSDPDLLKMPFVFLSTNDAFDLTKTEQANLREFFKTGGFLFADNPRPDKDNPGAKSLKRNIAEVLPDAVMAPMPNDHRLYHCFFDFDGPPQGTDIWRLLATMRPSTCGDNYATYRATLTPEHFYLEGFWLNDDLVAVYSDKGYIVKWNDTVNNEPQLRFAVNVMVYALTRGNTSAERNFKPLEVKP